jgi:phosphoribosyl 1,2-cyclic phosphodiesterase
VRFCSLGSGSEGNALLVEARDGQRLVRLLIDCGFGLKEAQRRLDLVGLAPQDLDAILVTHEHGDHVGGAFRLAAYAAVPLYMTKGTLRASEALAKTFLAQGHQVRWLEPDRTFEVGGVDITPVRVPHDALEPVQFVLDSHPKRLGVITDLGHGSKHVQTMFTRLDALVLETNHDRQMLEGSDYPVSLKRRISGDYGHLSNEAAAILLRGLDQGRLHTLCAAHLSQQNNHAELACQALAQVSSFSPDQVRVADQAQGLAWIEV